MPSSSARWMIGRLSCSSSAHFLQVFDPNPIVPSARRETFNPVDPKLTYSIGKIPSELECVTIRAFPDTAQQHVGEMLE
jgi:hypothetical protein